MPSFWGSCDVAAMPSDRCIESFGMAAVEAMACATPVVVSDNGALPELVADGVTGFVVPPANPQALADALLTLTRDDTRRRAAAEAARAHCEERFDIRDCAASYVRLFRSDGADLRADGS
jgi:glycosyltransferase involved in cell wall biosynthesis